MDELVIIELQEYVPRTFARHEIPAEVGEVLYREYGSKVEVEEPSMRTAGRWRLTSQGWVGYIPLGPEFALRLLPRVPLRNLFGMWEYAYNLPVTFLEGLMDCRSLLEFYEQLANILARNVLDRGRKGFYRSYVPQAEALPYLRGRLDVPQALRRPWEVQLPCHYQEHTADIEDNQILAWTLWNIARSGLCRERVLPTVRRAFRALQGLATLTPLTPSCCLGRLYNRLNEDYRPLHALCRFFLEHTGPGHVAGEHGMLPFLVHMPALYERFVAQWLRRHLPQHLRVDIQEKVSIDPEHGLRFEIDLVLFDVARETPLCVLDTKYKTADGPSSEDIQQIVAYAEAVGCSEAVLIYPIALAAPLDTLIGRKHVRSLTFALDGDLEANGWAFLQALGIGVAIPA